MGTQFVDISILRPTAAEKTASQWGVRALGRPQRRVASAV